MTEKQNKITINDKEYNMDDLTREQTVMVKHAQNLQNKVSTAEFELEELKFSLEAFVTVLQESLNESVSVSG